MTPSILQGSRKFVNWCSASNWLMFSHRLIFFCLWFSSSFFYDLILMAFLRRDRKRQIFCLLKGGGLLSDGNKEKFLWQFRDFVVRFLIKGLYFPHYYQMSFWSTSPLSYLFLLSLSLPQNAAVHLSRWNIHSHSISHQNVAPHIHIIFEKMAGWGEGGEREIYRLLFFAFYSFLLANIKTFCIAIIGVCVFPR